MPRTSRTKTEPESRHGLYARRQRQRGDSAVAPILPHRSALSSTWIRSFGTSLGMGNQTLEKEAFLQPLRRGGEPINKSSRVWVMISVRCGSIRIREQPSRQWRFVPVCLRWVGISYSTARNTRRALTLENVCWPMS